MRALRLLQRVHFADDTQTHGDACVERDSWLRRLLAHTAAAPAWLPSIWRYFLQHHTIDTRRGATYRILARRILREQPLPDERVPFVYQFTIWWRRRIKHSPVPNAAQSLPLRDSPHANDIAQARLHNAGSRPVGLNRLYRYCPTTHNVASLHSVGPALRISRPRALNSPLRSSVVRVHGGRLHHVGSCRSRCRSLRLFELSESSCCVPHALTPFAANIALLRSPNLLPVPFYRIPRA